MMFDLTPFLKLYAGFRSFVLQTRDPADAQAWVLKGLIRRAEMTRFGQDHAFASIVDVSDFQRRVPLRRYEDFWREYWQPDFPLLVDCTWPGVIPYFARTSGTTAGESKYIPARMT